MDSDVALDGANKYISMSGRHSDRDHGRCRLAIFDMELLELCIGVSS